MGNNLYPAIFFDTLSLFGALVVVIIRFFKQTGFDYGQLERDRRYHRDR